MTLVTIDALPEPIAIDGDHKAVIIFDMQRDFLESGGFGESLGNDVSLLAAAAVEPCCALLAAARAHGRWRCQADRRSDVSGDAEKSCASSGAVARAAGGGIAQMPWVAASYLGVAVVLYWCTKSQSATHEAPAVASVSGMVANK